VLRHPFRFGRLGLALLAVALLVACGASQASTLSPTASTTSEILSRASRQLAATKTVHFQLTVEGDTFIDPQHTLQLLSADGDLQRPDKVSTSFKVRVAGTATVGLKLITIGTKTWWTNLITGKWEPAPADLGYNPSVLFDNQGGIGPVMGRITNARQLPDAKVNGRAAYHVQAKVADAIVGPLTDNTMTGTPITVDLWIAKDNADLLRAQLAEPPQPGKAHPATWVLDLTKQNEKVSIEPPV